MSSPNPNWPRIQYAIAWQAVRGGPVTVPNWLDVTSRTEGTLSSTRGKQYELDQIQPGTATLTLRNDDGAFDPANTASPYAGWVKPHRLLRAAAQWPVTANLLTPDQATAFYASQGAGGAGSTLPPNVNPVTGEALNIVNVGTLNHYRAPLATGEQYPGIEVSGFAVAPGVTYTAQCEVVATITGLQVSIALLWYDVNGNITTGTNGTNAAPPTSGSALYTVTSTAPANACGALLVAQNVVPAPSTCTIDFWSIQVEQAATPSTYADPGTWYPLFTGYIERWPQSWSSGGNYGTISVTAVDVLSWLASYGLDYAAYLEVLALGPDWFYPLDEGQGATQFTDHVGTHPPLKPLNIFQGAYAYATDPTGDMVTGVALPAPVPAGIPGPVVQFNYNDTVGNVVTVLDLRTTGATCPPTTSGWTRIFAVNGKALASGGDTPILWSTCDRDDLGYPANGIFLQVGNGTGGEVLNYAYIGILKNGAPLVIGTAAGVALDGTWHLFAVTMNSSGTSLSVYNNGVFWGNLVTATDMRATYPFDMLGGSPQLDSGLNGYVSFAAQLPYEASGTQMANLWSAFTAAWTSETGLYTESSGARYQRILDWIGYTGPSRIDSGDLQTYGPATDIGGGDNPTAALAALQAVVDSEVGEQNVAADGTLVFAQRSDRWNATPVATFGEQSSETAYLSAIVDYDPTRLANDITTQVENANYGTASTARVFDATSKADYGTITLQQTINTISPGDLFGAAQYLLYQNAEPTQRLETLPVDVAAGLDWDVVLPLDLGACVQVNRRPANAPEISIVGFVEQIVWSISDTGAATWTVQISNAALHYFGTLDSAVYGLLDSTLILGY